MKLDRYLRLADTILIARQHAMHTQRAIVMANPYVGLSHAGTVTHCV